MTELIQESTLAEYEAFVQSHPKGHFAQSSLWAKQKPAWKWRAIVSRGADGRIRGSIAFLIRTMPYIHKTMLYACRGPVCDLDDRETFGELVAAARELAKEYKAYVIKIDPDVPVENEDFRRMLEDFGFRTRHGGKNFEAIQPKFVFRLWLNGRTEDELMASFHQKWRYNIRLAVKKGVEVRVCGKEMVPDFARLMLTTGVRDGFVTVRRSILPTCSTTSASTRGCIWPSTRASPSRVRWPSITATRCGISTAQARTSTATSCRIICCSGA